MCFVYMSDRYLPCMEISKRYLGISNSFFSFLLFGVRIERERTSIREKFFHRRCRSREFSVLARGEFRFSADTVPVRFSIVSRSSIGRRTGVARWKKIVRVFGITRYVWWHIQPRGRRSFGSPLAAGVRTSRLPSHLPFGTYR